MKKNKNKLKDKSKLMVWTTAALVIGFVIGLLITSITVGNAIKVKNTANQEIDLTESPILDISQLPGTNEQKAEFLANTSKYPVDKELILKCINGECTENDIKGILPGEITIRCLCRNPIMWKSCSCNSTCKSNLGYMEIHTRCSRQVVWLGVVLGPLK